MDTEAQIEHKREEEDDRHHFARFWIYYLFILMEAAVIILYWRFCEFNVLADYANSVVNSTSSIAYINHFYAFYQDVHVMIFIGFGFLMTFLKSHSWTSVGVNFIIGAWTIQWSILCIGFWKAVITNTWTNLIELDIKAFIDADFAAGSNLIAMGAVLGKINFMQYIVMSTVQTLFYALVYAICFYSFQIADLGGSITIHAFGAFFGLAVAMVIKQNHHHGHPSNGSNYNSNIFSMIGTIFLWMYWPSFNGAMESGNAKHRAIITTVLSLTGSCFMVFMMNPFFKRGKLHMEDILNATLAGGVIVGSCCNLITHAWEAILIGCGAGVISLVGFELLSPYLAKKNRSL